MSIELNWRRYSLASLSMLVLPFAFVPTRGVQAQDGSSYAPPDSLTAQAEGPTGILLQWVACQSSEQANCAETFYIYRNPPNLDSVLQTVSVNGNDSQQSYPDTANLKPSTNYTYLVCSGEKLPDKSNCLSVAQSTLAQSSSGSGGSGGSGNQGSNNGINLSPPPTNLRALAGDSAVLLDWQNPKPNPYVVSVVVEIYRALSGVPSLNAYAGQIAILNADGSAKVPPTRYQDNGPLGPHFTYYYYVCDGSRDVQMRNCALSTPVSTWGANPIMTATRSSPTTVKLSVAVDNLTTLSGLRITRQDNRNPCAQGATLANGEQGCKTKSYSSNGIPINAPIITTIYDKARPGTDFGANGQGAPYVIELPDDAVTAGVEYYYQAEASWGVVQDSQVATVPAGFKYLPQHRIVKNFPAGVKPVGVQPVGGTGGKGKPRTGAIIATGAALSAAHVKVKANPTDAKSLFALGQSYCKQNLRDVCVSTLYLGFLQSEKSGTAALTTQIKASLAAQGVAIK
jgi:hypothetical protein